MKGYRLYALSSLLLCDTRVRWCYEVAELMYGNIYSSHCGGYGTRLIVLSRWRVCKRSVIIFEFGVVVHHYTSSGCCLIFVKYNLTEIPARY